MLVLLVLKNAVECISQRLKWTSGVQVVVIFQNCLLTETIKQFDPNSGDFSVEHRTPEKQLLDPRTRRTSNHLNKTGSRPGVEHRTLEINLARLLSNHEQVNLRFDSIDSPLLRFF